MTRQTRRWLAGLLASGAEVEPGGVVAGPFRARLGLGIGVVGLLGALVLMATGGRGHGPEMAGMFFCSGLLVLCAGLGFTQHLLVRLPTNTHSHTVSLNWAGETPDAGALAA